MIGPDQAPTHAAVLELRQERGVVGEAYDFLDEKRLLLAAEILRQLELHAQQSSVIKTLSIDANKHFRAAIVRHGLQGLSVYPAATLEDTPFEMRKRNFMGVTLVATDMAIPEPDTAWPRPASRPVPGVTFSTVRACNPSFEAGQCRDTFQELLRHIAVLAGISGNLYRLLIEYRVTERRARALENVIMPEIEQILNVMTSHLEELDFEDAMRVRLQTRE